MGEIWCHTSRNKAVKDEKRPKISAYSKREQPVPWLIFPVPSSVERYI